MASDGGSLLWLPNAKVRVAPRAGLGMHSRLATHSRLGAQHILPCSFQTANAFPTLGAQPNLHAPFQVAKPNLTCSMFMSSSRMQVRNWLGRGSSPT